MKKLRSIGALACLSLVAVAMDAGAQSRIGATVAGGGGGSSGNGTTAICATVGQPVIGFTGITATVLHQGFWHPLRATATAGAIPGELPVTGRRALAARIWPNPSSGKADLSVDIPAAERFSATLHDLRGNAVRTLHDGFCPAGRLNIPLDGTDLPSGLYTVVLTSGTTRAMVNFHLTR